MRYRVLTAISILVIALLGGRLLAQGWEQENNHVNETEKAPTDSVISEQKCDTDRDNDVKGTFITVPDEQLEKNFGVPEEVLRLDTSKLLDYFWNSPFLLCDIISRSSFEVNSGSITDSGSVSVTTDYSWNKAFAELIKREDFLPELEKKARTVYEDTEMAFGISKLQAILSQPTVKELIGNNRSGDTDCRMLERIIEDDAQSSSRAAFYLNGIGYNWGGTVYSAGSNNGTSYYTADSDWSSTTISNINNTIFSQYGLNPIYTPTTKYNCHSYAWYRSHNGNMKWIPNPDAFRYDSVCSEVTPSTVHEKDIIVYLNANYSPEHSGVVWSITDGNITIRSKWGQSGVYDHPITNVPANYYFNSNGVMVVYYRYHDYHSQYAGQEYHSGNSHYYLYADTCSVCLNQTNFHWVEVPCSGPPCILPYMSIPAEDEEQ
jgi:hypothetical protein